MTHKGLRCELMNTLESLVLEKLCKWFDVDTLTEHQQSLCLTGYNTRDVSELINLRPFEEIHHLENSEYNSYLFGLFWNPWVLTSEKPLCDFFPGMAQRLIMARAPIPLQGIYKLANDSSAAVQGELLCQEKLPIDVLEKIYDASLVEGKIGAVLLRIRLAERWDLNEYLKARLVEDTDLRVLTSVSKNVTFSEESRVLTGFML